MADLFVHQMKLGPADNFVYLIGDPETKEMTSIDPSWDAAHLQSEAARLGYTITQIYLTHCHGDHVNALADLLALNPVPVYVSRHADRKAGGVDTIDMNVLDDGDTFNVGNIALQVIHTPGHSPGGLCLYKAPNLIAGDTLFIDGCGRCDLAHSDPDAMYNSIHNKLMKLPDDTLIYVGHDYGPKPVDTMGNQKQTNRFMVAKTHEAFIKERMG